MRSIHRDYSCDGTFPSERSLYSLQSVDGMTPSAGTLKKDPTTESTITSITRLVRRSFPRPFGRSSRQNLEGLGESATSASFRSSMYDEHTIDDLEMAAQQTPLQSNLEVDDAGNNYTQRLDATIGRNRSNRTTSAFLELNKVDEEETEHDNDQMALELSTLEDLLKSLPKSPTRLLSRGFPMTATLGSSLGSFDSHPLSSMDGSHTNDSNTNECHEVGKNGSISPIQRMEVKTVNVQNTTNITVDLSPLKNKNKRGFLSKLMRRSPPSK